MNLTKNFKKSEFECKCGCEMPDEVLTEITKLAGNLQVIRDFIRKPMVLTNAYRCAEHNKAVGGVANSQHILGKACDIQVKGISPKELFETIEILIKYGHISEGGLGLYNTFVHYDIRLTKARWDKTIE